MEVKMTNQNVMKTLNHVFTLLKEVNPQKLNYSLIKIKHKLESKVKIIQKELNDLEIARTDLCIKYCIKTNDNKPIIIDNNYTGLEPGVSEEFDKEIDLNRKAKIKYLETITTLENVYGIKSELLPEKMSGEVQEYLMPFIIKNEKEMELE